MLFPKMIDRRIEAYQSDLLQKYCDEVESMYRKMRSWRHDYHNHIQALQASMVLGRYEEVMAYLCTLVAVNDGKYAELWRAQAQYYKT